MPETGGSTLFRFLSSFFFIIAMVGCKVIAAPPPYEEYTLARAAIRAAQDVDSARFAPSVWNKAEENYRAGQKSYKETDYDQAKKYFQAALQFAEKAENLTRLKKFQSGDSFP